MIVESYKSGTTVWNQKVKYKTVLFGKQYFWMQDVDGTLYLLPSKDDQPDFGT